MKCPIEKQGIESFQKKLFFIGTKEHPFHSFRWKPTLTVSDLSGVVSYYLDSQLGVLRLCRCGIPCSHCWEQWQIQEPARSHCPAKQKSNHELTKTQENLWLTKTLGLPGQLIFIMIIDLCIWIGCSKKSSFPVLPLTFSEIRLKYDWWSKLQKTTFQHELIWTKFGTCALPYEQFLKF